MFRLNVRTRLARFKPREPLPDPRAVEVMYNASELIQPAHCSDHKRFEYDCMDCVEEVS